MFIEHLIENEICKYVEEIEREEQISRERQRPSSETATATMSYWNQAVSKHELFQYHFKKYKEHERRKNASQISEIFHIKKSARAICEKGNKTCASLYFVGDSFFLSSDSCDVFPRKTKMEVIQSATRP